MKLLKKMTKDLLKMKLCSCLRQRELRYANCFLRSQWETEKTASVEYFVYRIWHAAAAFLLMFLSIVEAGKPIQIPSHYFKWPIYLTNWGLMLNVIQAFIAVTLMMLARSSHEADSSNLIGPKMNGIFQIYWCLHSCSVTVALGVTSMYWLFIYNPDSYELDIPNFASHLFNSVVMGVDFIAVGHPFELVHAIFPLIFVTVYIAFNFVYYIFGGLSRKGTVALYEAMDWENPSTCIKFVGAGYVVLTSIHIFLSLVYVVKRKISLSLKWRYYRKDNMQSPVNDNTVV